jgi:hypothetical protein
VQPALAPILALAASLQVGAPLAQERAIPWEIVAPSWRTDPVWHDGRAEKCVYEATRTIYGLERRYLATAYTNKERVDPLTTVKTEDGGGLEVFKHHWSELVPTESYDYDFSTSSYVSSADLSAFKLTAATQEDCGASFKQVWRDGGALVYWESVYFPGAGTKQGRIEPSAVVFEDALALVLRDMPFSSVQAPDIFVGHELLVLPSQKDTRSVSYEPLLLSAVAAPAQLLSLPIGEVRAHTVTLDREGEVRARYWFAADGSAPWLHALVQYEGPDGVRYRLKSLERTAYWKRP